MQHATAIGVVVVVIVVGIVACGTERDVEQRVVCSGGGCVALEEVGDAWMWCEAEHVL